MQTTSDLDDENVKPAILSFAREHWHERKNERSRPKYWSTRPTRVPAGNDHYFQTGCPSVRPIQNFKIKRQSLPAGTVGWPSGSLMTPILFCFHFRILKNHLSRSSKSAQIKNMTWIRAAQSKVHFNKEKWKNDLNSKVILRVALWSFVYFFNFLQPFFNFYRTCVLHLSMYSCICAICDLALTNDSTKWLDSAIYEQLNQSR